MYYIVSEEYVGPNVDQQLDTDTIEIRTEPVRGNMNSEPVIDGWAGTVNDWAAYGHGEFTNLDDARKRIAQIWSEVRVDEQWSEEYFPALVERYKPGRYAPLSEEHIQTYMYDELNSNYLDYLSDDKLAEFVCECEAAQNSEGYTMYSGIDPMDVAREIVLQAYDEVLDENEAR